MTDEQFNLQQAISEIYQEASDAMGINFEAPDWHEFYRQAVERMKQELRGAERILAVLAGSKASDV